jgi:hypothetical protein
MMFGATSLSTESGHPSGGSESLPVFSAALAIPDLPALNFAIGRYRRAAFADFRRAKVSAAIVSAIKSPKPNAVSLTGTFIKVTAV